MRMIKLKSIYDRLITGDASVLYDIENTARINTNAVYLITNPHNWTEHEITKCDLIIRISNVAYNNTSIDILPLDDGVYDQLLEIYKQYNPNYLVGAPPVIFSEYSDVDVSGNRIMATMISQEDFHDSIFLEQMWKQNTDRDSRLKTMAYDTTPITKRLVNKKHSYPQLVGTLDKCKFVLNEQARQAGVFDKSGVAVFERDFIGKHLEQGIISPTEEFEMLLELKYDGVSVEADVLGDTIISAGSRGDTAEDFATDLTPILGGYKYMNAFNKVPSDLRFGIKHEAIITHFDMQRLSAMRGKPYKNARNAIIGLFGSSDAAAFADLITLVPLSSSLDMGLVDEVSFLNQFYSSGQLNRCQIIKGTYIEILFLISTFVKEMEKYRSILPFMIDGIVVSYTDPDKIAKLGRVNSVDKYKMAIKFNPAEANTVVYGVEFTIGKTGNVTPKVHFRPIEFLGNIQTNQTIHSYKKFMEMGLRVGSEIKVSYHGDVMSYIEMLNTQRNAQLAAMQPPIPFISTCPYCGSKIIISESGDSAKCMNRMCSGRRIGRMVDMLKNIGIKDFAESAVKTLSITSLKDFMSIDEQRAALLGGKEAQNLLSALDVLRNSKINDYLILTALSFDNTAAEKWKLILGSITLEDLVYLSDTELYSKLTSIKGIGNKTVNVICECRKEYADDLKYILTMNNIIRTPHNQTKLPRIAFTGDRNTEFINALNANGYDASADYGVTKNTFALIVSSNPGNSKIVKATEYGIPMYSAEQFINAYSIKI